MPDVLLDNDTGVDDALALVYLASRPDVRIHLISSTAGNVDADLVARNNLGILQLCGLGEVPVVVGASRPLEIPLTVTPETHGPQGIGYATVSTTRRPDPGDAAQRWVDLARRHPGRFDAVCTAPLTNLALALRLEPRLPELLRSLTIMGGSFLHPGNTTPTAEWNIHSDPHAAAEVFAAYDALPHLPVERLPLICALETTERFELTPEHVRAWRREAAHPSGAGEQVLHLLEEALRFYFEFHEQYGYGRIAHVHDYAATAAATGGIRLDWTPQTVQVQTGPGPAVGTTVADVRHLLGRRPNARIATGGDPVAAFAHLHERVVGLVERLSAA
ncbi:nucleoside hydrolase [Rothia kristinae]|uniref:Nucleoside hydrolase n=1 Tax=Rothia kristinae TaxID=37923 RepID=A0A7T4MVE2_9MICC|nr:nucleoside hydrolase [Rothia kristinae]QQC60323.1 nucleoside hydrolase [Rothia kristinae]